jgi:hypothetical protein
MLHDGSALRIHTDSVGLTSSFCSCAYDSDAWITTANKAVRISFHHALTLYQIGGGMYGATAG